MLSSNEGKRSNGILFYFIFFFFEEVKYIYVFILVLIEKNRFDSSEWKRYGRGRGCFETGERGEEKKKKNVETSFTTMKVKGGREIY